MSYEIKEFSDLGLSFYYNDNIEVIADDFSTNEDLEQIQLLKKKKFKQSFINEIIDDHLSIPTLLLSSGCVSRKRMSVGLSA
jgi:hypothetical protein